MPLNFVQALGPKLDVLDFVGNASSEAFDWSRMLGGTVQDRAVGLMSITGFTGTTGIITFQMDTSFDGITWFDAAPFADLKTADATTHNQVLLMSGTARKPLRYIRMTSTADSGTITAGTITWGVA